MNEKAEAHLYTIIKEKEEAHLYTIIKVARDDDLVAQIGKDIFFDLVDYDKGKSFRIDKQMPFVNFKEVAAKEFGVPVQFQRFWLWAQQQNHTYRPNCPLTMREEKQTVGQLEKLTDKADSAELNLFLEVELGPLKKLNPLPPPKLSKEDILLFFKLYDPENEQLGYVGRLFVKRSGKPADILSKLNKMAGFPLEEEIYLYEVNKIMFPTYPKEKRKFEPTVMCKNVNKRLLFRSSQLENGDILYYQRTLEADTVERYCYPDVPSYLEYICNRQVVRFHSLEKPKDENFSLEMSNMFTYDDVVERVACQLGMGDPSRIRLTSQQPIKYRGVKHLSDMLVHDNQTHVLYYEVLDIPLPELESLKTLKVAFHQSVPKDEASIHSIRLRKDCTAADVLNNLRSKVELSHPNVELRLLKIVHHTICQIFAPNERIDNNYDWCATLRVEEIPEEEKNLGPHDRLIHVYHFAQDTQNKMQIQNFGEPFLLVIREGETLSEVKTRIQKKLQVPDEIFTEWKFAHLLQHCRVYIQDSDVVFSRFQMRNACGAWGQFLGLEHSKADMSAIKTAVKLKEAEIRARNAEEKSSEFEMRLKEAEIRALNAEVKSLEYEMRLKEAEMRARNAEGKSSEFESSEFEVWVKEVEMRAESSEFDSSEFEVRLKEAEMRACNAEEKSSEFDVRVKEAEIRARNAEVKSLEFEVRLKEANTRAYNSEEKSSEFESSEFEVTVKEAEMRDRNAEGNSSEFESSEFEVRVKEAEMRAYNAEEKSSEFEVRMKEAEMRPCNAEESRQSLR